MKNMKQGETRGWGLPPESVGWFGFAIAGLLLSGVFAILIVLGRTPGVAPLLGDAEFFRRSLVVHVNLALVVWFSAFILGLVHLLPRRPVRCGQGLRWLGHTLFGAGMVLMMAGAWVPGSRAILANYVPGVDNWLFMSGLGLIALGALHGLLSGSIWGLLGDSVADRAPPGSVWRFALPEDARLAVSASGLALLLALLTFGVSAASALELGRGDGPFTLAVWGGGHVMQTANVAAMSAVWLTVVSRALGRPVLTRRAAQVLFGWLLVPAIVSPWVVWVWGVSGPTYQIWFVRMMQFGLFPPVLVLLGATVFRLWGCRHGGWRWSSALMIGWQCSVALTLAGFVLGAMIRGSSTMIPAHYHAAIGGVTVAFMAMTWLWWREVLGSTLALRVRRMFALQPVLFTVGQLGFALGFALAGASGMARKVYGEEQVTRTAAEVAGLGLMALGGLVAVAGGLVFLGLFGRLLFRRLRAADPRQEEERWTTMPPIESIPSSG